MFCNAPHVKDTRRCLLVPGKQGSPKLCTLASTVQFVLPWHFRDTLLKADGDKHSEMKIHAQSIHKRTYCIGFGLFIQFSLKDLKVMEIYSLAPARLLYKNCSLDVMTELLFSPRPMSGLRCESLEHIGVSCFRWPNVAE